LSSLVICLSWEQFILIEIFWVFFIPFIMSQIYSLHYLLGDQHSARTCRELVCRFGAVCKMISGRPRCTCNEDCSHVKNVYKVCASNGDTYSSECEMRRFGCRLQKHVHVVHKGECQSKSKDCFLIWWNGVSWLFPLGAFWCCHQRINVDKDYVSIWKNHNTSDVRPSLVLSQVIIIVVLFHRR